MSFSEPLEHRLRARIDTLKDERDLYRQTVLDLTAENRVLAERLANCHATRGFLEFPHWNQHGPCLLYETDAERQAARRLTWRTSKRRKRGL